jgi:hypothetical protein
MTFRVAVSSLGFSPYLKEGYGGVNAIVMILDTFSAAEGGFVFHPGRGFHIYSMVYLTKQLG